MTIAVVPETVLARLVELGDQTRGTLNERLQVGERVPVGQRTDALKARVIELIGQGFRDDELLEEAFELNRVQLGPPQLDEKVVRTTVRNLVRWHELKQRPLREKARAVLERRSERKPPLAGGLIISMSEFLASAGEEGEPIVAHLVYRSSSTLKAGLPKVGKSTFVYGMLGAITRGSEFLGLPVQATDVLLLTEEPAGTVEEKVDRFGIDENRIFVLPKRRTRGTLKWARIVDEAVKFCETHPTIGVVVVDTLDKFIDLDARRSESDTGVIRESFELLYGLLALGVAVVLITHQRKEEGSFGLACAAARR